MIRITEHPNTNFAIIDAVFALVYKDKRVGRARVLKVAQ
jgi:hypothetical protein